MRRYDAIGVIETQYFTYALEILDAMCKSAAVEFLTSENYLGGRLVTVIIGGSVSDVNVAVDTARRIGESQKHNPIKMALTISNPHPEILSYIIKQEVDL